jgi:hypothetical protein
VVSSTFKLAEFFLCYDYLSLWPPAGEYTVLLKSSCDYVKTTQNIPLLKVSCATEHILIPEVKSTKFTAWGIVQVVSTRELCSKDYMYVHNLLLFQINIFLLREALIFVPIYCLTLY